MLAEKQKVFKISSRYNKAKKIYKLVYSAGENALAMLLRFDCDDDENAKTRKTKNAAAFCTASTCMKIANQSNWSVTKMAAIDGAENQRKTQKIAKKKLEKVLK